MTAIVGESLSIVRLRQLIDTVAPTRLPVLIEGPTGSGKELVAARLHAASRRSGSLVAFNVCALGDSMFEDALFGHVRGAYTGAIGESLGFLREANGGSAFFDEIGGLPLAQQAKLLRAIETGVFRPIGSSRDARSDFRPIAATNEPLASLIADGRFRADLAHRLSGIVLTVPPLADRIEDIPILAAHFTRLSDASCKLTRRAECLLQQRAWPGNVRELRQVIDTAVVLSRDQSTLDADAIELALRHRSSSLLIAAPPGIPAREPSSRERDQLVALLQDADWNTRRLARRLGIHRATVYRRAKRLGISMRIECRVMGAPLPLL
ncbi:MAG TPA: sigma 54-interacting transcriptional regulator [Gemmatimonadaceae bacterium]|nr:sigma 54-interacting transcriptional regulator [Gemmatimonadaceae bacterium]